ncbi:hypothetical protein INT43_002662 [Umbelopsis isabellina]|uniref:RRM domain-containing protein n=1 Tax=Mortierella isabellina TaxID=91625 RepID=A0A8H7Q493_MORIS|nr:hypothetical protein INT43_002662 [Umbelopsis isabellina]
MRHQKTNLCQCYPENVAITKRVYIGGLPSIMTDDDLKTRFKMFGDVLDASIAKDSENKCRGFGHLTINTTTNQWTKCLSVYNHAKWKGGIMKIEDAKPDWKSKREAERVQAEARKLKKEERANKRRRTTDADGYLARDMTLVNDKNVDGRKGWKRGRYGRAIAVMRLQKDNGTKIVFDPVHYKNNLLKIYELTVRMKPTRSLPVYYEDFADEKPDPYDHASDNEQNEQEMDDVDSDFDVSKNELRSTADLPQHKLTKEEVNEKRLESLRQREEERQREKEKVATMLAQVESGQRKDGHVTFVDEGGAEVQLENDEPQNKQPVSKQPKDAAKWMFDSDSDDDDAPVIDINPVMEGEKGRDRLELQRTFGGDDRFKLGADFMDNESDEDDVWATEETNKPVIEEQDEIAAELSQEKSTSMDLLKAMFGEDNRTALTEVRKSAGWTPMLRFDPDAEDTELLAENAEPAESVEADQNDISTDISANIQPNTAPEVSTDKHYQVNINLKPLFTPGAQEAPFKLFGGDTDTEEEEEEEEEEDEQMMEDASNVMIAEPKIQQLVQSRGDKVIQAQSMQRQQMAMKNAPLFFFHFDKPELSKR